MKATYWCGTGEKLGVTVAGVGIGMHTGGGCQWKVLRRWIGNGIGWEHLSRGSVGKLATGEGVKSRKL